MTEREKKELGLLHNAFKDKKMYNELIKTKKKCFKYNNIAPHKINKRKKLLKKILGKTKQNINVTSPFNCDYGYNIEIGKNFFSNSGLTILDIGKVVFGNNVFIGPNCIFLAVGHPIDATRRNSGDVFGHQITVGNNVWFGGNVTVLHGVTIGDNVVIGCGSVVTRNIPSGVVAFGNPCKVKRKITKKDSKKEYLFNNTSA